MFSARFVSAALASLVLLQQATALGINCRGSGLCPLAGFENDGDVGIMQGLRDAMYSVDNATVPGSTMYKDGDHVICVSSSIKISISAGVSKAGVSATVGLNGKLGIGGVCAFPQNTGSGITLDRARELMDGLLQHGCTVCGSNPTQPGNNVKNGQLTINYVKNPDCVGECLGAGAGLNPTAGKDQASSAAAEPATSAAPTSVASPSSPASSKASATSATSAAAASDTSSSDDSDSDGDDDGDDGSDSEAATSTTLAHAEASSSGKHGNATTFSTHTRAAATTAAPGSDGQQSYTLVPYIAYSTVML